MTDDDYRMLPQCHICLERIAFRGAHYQDGRWACLECESPKSDGAQGGIRTESLAVRALAVAVRANKVAFCYFSVEPCFGNSITKHRCNRLYFFFRIAMVVIHHVVRVRDAAVHAGFASL